MLFRSPSGPVYQAGTLSGNPVATTAGLTTLRLADDAVYRSIDEWSAEARRLVSDALDEAGVPHVVQEVGSMFSILWGTTTRARSFADVQAQEAWRYGPFFHAMLEAGIYLPPSAYESWFVSAAHDDQGLSRMASALPAAARAAAAAPPTVSASASE